MEKTGVVINRDSWLLLQDEPFYSARFIDRDGTEELALVVRVEELEGVEEIVHFGEIQSFHDRCQEWLTRIRFSVVSHFEIFSPRASCLASLSPPGVDCPFFSATGSFFCYSLPFGRDRSGRIVYRSPFSARLRH